LRVGQVSLSPLSSSVSLVMLYTIPLGEGGRGGRGE
jgi:hypothetical protein